MADPKTAQEALDSGDFEAATALLEAEASSAKAQGPDAETQPDSDTSADAAPEGEQQKPAEAAPETGTQPAAQQIDGVLTKDGKHVIPYSVLETTRQRAEESERQRQQLQQELQARQSQQSAIEIQLAELRQKVEIAAAKSGAEVDELAQAADPENPLAGFDEDDLPESLVQITKALHARLQAANRQISTASKELAELKQTATTAAAQVLQAEIDANPTLVAWQAERSEAWAKAVEVDDRLRMDPKWAEKPVAERFGKVVKLVCAELDLEEIARPKGAERTAQPEAAVTSISDLPGGSPSHQTGYDALESASGRQVMGMFGSMSDEQIERTLRGLG